MEKLNQGQEKFVNRYTRKLLVGWAHMHLTTGVFGIESQVERRYLDFAISKGWVSKDVAKITSLGYKVASSFLG
jgi:hypothetical protein